MAKTLQDPNLPAGAIIDERPVGSALRNDGVELGAANKNRWYVLATIFGEQEEGAKFWEQGEGDKSGEKGKEAENSRRDRELAAKNRRAWNGWACAGLTDEEREKLAADMGLSAADDLAPLSDDELAEITGRFRARLGRFMELPKPEKTVDLSATYFKNPLGFEKYVVFCDVDFEFAVFRGVAVFSSTVFCSIAVFSSTVFRGPAHFRSTVFRGVAVFSSTVFRGPAYFRAANFYDEALFHSTVFRSIAVFSTTVFSSLADLSSTVFRDAAVFRSAVFRGYAGFRHANFRSTTAFEQTAFRLSVPEFHGAKLSGDTVFELKLDKREHWPPVKQAAVAQRNAAEGDEDREVMDPKDQKRAYNRLRLFMNQNLQFEEEQFFHRMEMACTQELAVPGMRALYRGYEVLSGYGWSLMRPLGGLAGLVVCGWLPMAGFLAKPGAGLSVLLSAFGWSLANVFPLFGFRRLVNLGLEEGKGLPVLLDMLAGAQTVLGFTFLFLLGLGLRNRFRLR